MIQTTLGQFIDTLSSFDRDKKLIGLKNGIGILDYDNENRTLHISIEGNENYSDEETDEEKKGRIKREFGYIINRNSLESFFGDIPDFILADIAYKAMTDFGKNYNRLNELKG